MHHSIQRNIWRKNRIAEYASQHTKKDGERTEKQSMHLSIQIKSGRKNRRAEYAFQHDTKEGERTEKQRMQHRKQRKMEEGLRSRVSNTCTVNREGGRKNRRTEYASHYIKKKREKVNKGAEKESPTREQNRQKTQRLTVIT